MTHPNSNEPDPVVTWASAGPQPHSTPHQELAPEAEVSPWRWGWSVWIGIHYGPIPVGLIIGIPMIIALTTR